MRSGYVMKKKTRQTGYQFPLKIVDRIRDRTRKVEDIAAWILGNTGSC
jgi:hypothetical protein